MNLNCHAVNIDFIGFFFFLFGFFSSFASMALVLQEICLTLF